MFVDLLCSTSGKRNVAQRQDKAYTVTSNSMNTVVIGRLEQGAVDQPRTESNLAAEQGRITGHG